ncbi:bifunctional 3-phenylpropionate/cinnamic acid dioxygenase ferredoxin subunit [Streptomyces hygroscopicus]|uniref:bifunctional 3-phenylpropionate/cinnamic acid dioxygenase ferredoxin subunit n=1 Tax=Streptomyces hygroscopicus TaxID=1912 RepID=UPI003695BA79
MIPVCRIEDLPEGESVRVEAGDATAAIAVFHTGGAFYAIDDTCSHQDASLSDGWLEGAYVECPLHAALFDLRSGRPTCLPARRPVTTHAVTVVDGMLYVHPSVTTVPGDPVRTAPEEAVA